MPVLDPSQEQLQQQQQQQSEEGPVSMPSLDDDGDSSQPSNTEHIPMDLDDIQNAADGGQIKFILNEDGQLLQLDNHIITTDAEGNQILVQGTDSEQIQQLLQSVGVLRAGEGDGETFQMIQGENNQMIIVQGDNNETQLIDASMLNEDGHLVIQHQDGEEISEQMHVVNEDGVQVPVSIAYTHEHEQHHQQQHAEDQQQQHLEQQDQQLESHQQQQQQEQDGAADIKDSEFSESSQTEDQTLVENEGTVDSNLIKTEESLTTAQPVSSTTGEVFFNLDDLMQHPEQKVR